MVHSRIFTLGAALALAIAACGGDESTGLTTGGSGAAGGSGGRGGSAGATGTAGKAGASGSGNGGNAGSGGTAGGAGGNAGGAIDAGGGDSALDASMQDTGSPLDSTVDLSVPDSGTSDAGMVDGGGCPLFALGGATEEVYVDKSVAQTGNGTKQCPFKTILEATNLAAPAAGVTRRTIHVKGNNSAPDYVESQAIVLRPRVTLTSDYDASNPGGVSTVRISARGDCTTFTGAAVATFCAVAMDNDARLEKLTVRSAGMMATGNGVLTTSGLPTPPAVAPAVVDVDAENAPEAGFRVYGSVTLGPRVNATGNRIGLNATRMTAAALAIIQVNDAPTLAGAPSNSFSSNTNAGGGNGISIFGNYVVTIDGANASSNGANGMVIGTPYTATTTEKHRLANFHADVNTTTGLRVVSGEVHVVAGANSNTFNNNRNGYGIQATTGDSVGDVRIILEPKGTPGSYLIAHQANGNRLGGVHLNRATPPATAPHQIASLEARQNGSASSGVGIFVEIVGTSGPNQSSLVLRGSTLIGNIGAGLRFQKGSTNTLDIGTVNDGGYNVFGDSQAANRNTKTGICYENPLGGSPNLPAEYDRWSQCPPPLGNMSFQGSVSGCGANVVYTEITYTGATAPIPSVTNCF
jgi:hypothetical protein